MTAYTERAVAHGTNPVAAAASVAFGFVYAHLFEDGNGRLHRWLFHHVLAVAGFTPPGLVFPVSAAILREIQAYRAVLESYSRPLLPVIAWQPTARHNIEVTNDTARFYRYFHATAHAEFLYRCVAQALDRDLPEEVSFLQAYDRFYRGIQAITDMPARSVGLLRAFLAQNDGRLSGRARRPEFAMLSNAEAGAVEMVYAESFQAVGSFPNRGEEFSP